MAGESDFRLKDLMLAQLEQEERRWAEVLRKVEKHEMMLVALSNERADLALKLHKKLLRVRSGIRGYLGKNSSEYEQAGGTRTVECKRSGPKIKTPAAPVRAGGRVDHDELEAVSDSEKSEGRHPR